MFEQLRQVLWDLEEGRANESPRKKGWITGVRRTFAVSEVPDGHLRKATETGLGLWGRRELGLNISAYIGQDPKPQAMPESPHCQLGKDMETEREMRKDA